MGYRNEIAYAVVFTNTADRDAFLAALPDGDLEELQADGLKVKGNGLYFYNPWTKWDASRLSFGADGMTSVDRHENLLRLSREAADDTPLTGVFIRIGEETDDVEEESWGGYYEHEGLPNPWELAQVSRMAALGNDWPQD